MSHESSGLAHAGCRLQPITDLDDPRLEAYRDVRERDLVGRQHRFVIEGEVVLRVAATRSIHEIESVLLSDRRVDALGPVIDALDPQVPVYVAGQSVIDAIAGFPVHRGVLGIGRRAPQIGSVELLAGMPARACVVCPVGIANHDNIGGIFRNAAAFGADAVLLDRASCDPLYRKAIRVSVGGSLVVPFAREDDADVLLNLVKAEGFVPVGLSPHGAAALADMPRPERLALFLGAEGPGLPEGLLRRLVTVRIPMAGNFDSLNVATTSGIALHHFIAASPPDRHRGAV